MGSLWFVCFEATPSRAQDFGSVLRGFGGAPETVNCSGIKLELVASKAYSVIPPVLENRIFIYHHKIEFPSPIHLALFPTFFLFGKHVFVLESK